MPTPHPRASLDSRPYPRTRLGFVVLSEVVRTLQRGNHDQIPGYDKRGLPR